MDSLSRIAIFVEVARQESFAGAARELGLTASAVSKQVQNLESELKARLLNRTTRKVSLTEEGALFFERASHAIADIREATDQINELKSTPRGGLKISVPTALGIRHLNNPIAAFARRYPEVTLDIQYEDRYIDIVEENFDLVLRIGTLADSSLVARKLATCPIRIYCSPTYLETHGEPRVPDDLTAHNVLAYTRNKGAHEWRYQTAQGKEGVVALKSNFKCDFAEMMIEAAIQDIGILICPNIFIQQPLAEGKLVQILADYPTSPERHLYAVFQANRFISTRLRLFVDHIHDYCRHTFA